MRANKPLIALFATLATTPAIATEFFIGATAGSQATEVKLDKDRTRSSDTALGLRAGVIIADNHRITGSYSRAEGIYDPNKKGDMRNHNILASYDYLVNIGDTRLKWFGGVSAGAGVFKDGSLGNEAKMAYGVQTGLSYNFDNGISTELGYRYLKHDMKAKGANTGSTLAIDNTQQLYVGIDYRF
ncbi:outer membrane beta-barrel protein [Paraferrimonas haliotis]|uniref:PhoP/Q and low Mg2+ inducible outer membrane protein H1 n=1 Tax=Paraferrimonas haliotis TaxID=2013866 RepID=A0AA37TMU4_9GAMM|nr:outer membrane beta-barrel protein [Paraferrimonas haliotis]GLS84337.1 PhoP/Q and low Mg2+ inducible outer membrane protein H1 [Paraferrimonas haliotis]